MVSSIATLALLGAAALVEAVLPNGRPNANVPPRPSVPKVVAEDAPVTDVNGAALPPVTTTYYFQQLVDHNNPSAGTFSQRYWSTWQFWKPGGCVVLFTPGESNADGYTGYLTNVTVNGQIAQQQNCATVVIEHRFFGFSNPKPDLTTQSLQLLTLEQSILDLDYFAKNVKLPMPGGDKVTPDVTPWVLVGGSYSGALTSWTMSQVDSFYAGYASSAVVEAITDFWGYFEPIRQQMPKNCSADVEAVVSHIDSVFTFGSTSQKNSIKSLFGLTNLTHLDDVAGALRSNLWDWQSVQPDSGANTEFRKFCDALEVRNGTNAPASGWGLEHALPAWGNYWTSYYIDETCGGLDVVDCFSTYLSKSNQYTNTTINNAGRSWTWFTCNEVGFFQDGAPLTWPSLVSRLAQPTGDLRTCSYYFPQHGVIPPTTLNTNVRYEGWNANIPRVFYATGRNDPWREATVAADGSPFKNTTSHPVGLSDGYHCSDLITREGTHDATVLAVQQQGLAAMSRWLPTFKPKKAKRTFW